FSPLGTGSGTSSTVPSVVESLTRPTFRRCLTSVLIVAAATGLTLLMSSGQPTAGAEPRGQNYAFLVACQDYDAKELNKLKYTPADLRAFHQTLLDSGYRDDHIVLMHDDQKRRFTPEGAKIREELKLLLDGLGADDSVIVALSGHGVQFKGEKQSYFCPVD